jgi:hypothetical protein
MSLIVLGFIERSRVGGRLSSRVARHSSPAASAVPLTNLIQVPLDVSLPEVAVTSARRDEIRF